MGSELTATQDQFLAVLSLAAGDPALGGHAGLRDRMAPTVAATFTTTQGMVDGVHGFGTGVRADAAMTISTGFTETDVDLVEVTDLADGGAAGAADTPHFA